ncbi:MAG TPA: hypothetical protein VGK94_02975 [Candidatus Polarisedimenticolia bacterium]|jgi:hypothetical protein
MERRVMGNFDFESARRFLDEGEYVEAIRCLLASLDADPANVEAYVVLFKAYDAAWHESGDPLVLDQMRKVAMAGLKRDANPEQRAFLEAALDRAEAVILEVQREEEEAERQEEKRLHKLPIIKD